MTARFCLCVVSACVLAACDSRTDQPAGGTRTTTTNTNGAKSGAANTTMNPGMPAARSPAGSTDTMPAMKPSPAPPMPTPPMRDGTSTDPSGTPGGTMSEDAAILSFLHATDQDEVRVGTLAQGKATSAMAKSYADMLVKDHTDHDAQVMSLAKSANITLSPPPAPKGEDPAAILGPLTGAAFDKKFGELMAAGHRDAIQTAEAAQPKLTNADVRALVDKTLPVLRHHLEMAQSIAGGTPTAPTAPSTP